MPVIDASIYVSLVNEADRHHLSCVEWLKSCLRGRKPLAAPNLLLVEVAASIRRLTGESKLAQRVLSELHAAELIDLYPLTMTRSTAAANLAASTGVRGADAVYLALAGELGDTLVTLDRQQLERSRGAVDVARPF